MNLVFSGRIQKTTGAPRKNMELDHGGLAHQALAEFEDAHGAFGVAVDESVVKDARAAVATARATKCSACIIDACLKNEGKSELRGLFQAEIKALRGHGHKEKELLHPLLYQRVLKGLAMRG